MTSVHREEGVIT